MPDSATKIAFLWRSSSLTGAQKRFLSMAQALQEHGYQAIVLLEEKDAAALKVKAEAEIPCLVTYRLPLWVGFWQRGRGRLPRLWKMLRMELFLLTAYRAFFKSLLKKHGVGLCHVAMSPFLSRVVEGPCIFEVTSPDWADRLADSPRIVPENVVLHAVSESVEGRLRLSLPNRRVVRAPGIFPNLDPNHTPPPDFDTKENLIVFAHRLIPRKNGRLFARAAKRFLATHPGWKISIRGEGPESDEIQDILADEIQDNRVEFGFTPGLEDELRRSRVFVSIIEPDNYPSQSVVEAMAHGNALLLSDQGRSREKFFDGNGVVTALDETSVLNGLIELTSNDLNLAEQGWRSRQLACERFSQHTYLEHHLIPLYARTVEGVL